MSHVEAWKPSIQYFDYYVQSTDEEVVRQVFPYVKVLYSLYIFDANYKTAFLKLHSSGVLDRFKKIVIASDGGPGHFKVYKTQFWMSRWATGICRSIICLILID